MIIVFLLLQHDFPPECRPGGLDGNYIMFASATSGNRPNNSKFSKCSIGNISNVLDAIEDNKKRNCFTGIFTFKLFSRYSNAQYRLNQRKVEIKLIRLILHRELLIIF